MTTFGTFDVDSVPAPSDCEFEPTPKIPFNRATTLLGLTGRERELFQKWYTGAGPFTMDGWRACYEVFTLQNDDDGMVALADRQDAAEFARHDRSAEHADLY